MGMVTSAVTWLSGLAIGSQIAVVGGAIIVIAPLALDVINFINIVQRKKKCLKTLK